MKKKRIFILGYFGYYNIGDDLMLEIIRSSFLKNNEIVFLVKKDHYYSFPGLYINRFNLLKYIFYIRKNDLLINLGGLFQEKSSFFSFLYYYVMNLLFLMKKGKISFINTDFWDVSSLWSLLSFLLKQSILTVLRSQSEYLSLKNRFNHVLYLPDLLFTFSGLKTKRKNKSSYTLLSVKNLISRDKFLGIINQYKDVKILIMGKDVNMINQIREMGLKQNIYRYKYNNLGEIIDLIGNAEKVISMQYHICILSLLLSKEVCIIPSNKKLISLKKDYNVPFIQDKKKIDKTLKRDYINKIKAEWLKVFHQISKYEI